MLELDFFPMAFLGSKQAETPGIRPLQLELPATKGVLFQSKTVLVLRD